MTFDKEPIFAVFFASKKNENENTIKTLKRRKTKMKKKEKTYIIIFDKHKNFKEICMLSESSDPFVVNPKSVGDSIYIYTQKEFAKLIESSMRYLTEPVGDANDSHANKNDMSANIGKEVILPYGKNYLKYYKVPIGTCSDSSSSMPTETATTDVAREKNSKKKK